MGLVGANECYSKSGKARLAATYITCSLRSSLILIPSSHQQQAENQLPPSNTLLQPSAVLFTATQATSTRFQHTLLKMGMASDGPNRAVILLTPSEGPCNCSCGSDCKCPTGQCKCVRSPTFENLSEVDLFYRSKCTAPTRITLRFTSIFSVICFELVEDTEDW